MRAKIVWIVIILVAIGYFGNNYLQERAKEKADREKAERIENEIQNKISQLVTNNNAIADWEQKLSRGEKVVTQKILTVNLEKLWMSGRPILFTGSIQDITNADEQNYILYLRKGIPLNDITVFLETSFALKIKCNKISIDKLLTDHPEVIQAPIKKEVAVVANIDKIVTDYTPTKEGEAEELKVGMGYCVDIIYTGRDIL